MTLNLNLPDHLERGLLAAAARQGMPVSQYALHLLAKQCPESAAPRPSTPIGHPPGSGAELVAYWRSQGVIGWRTDITDAQAHARKIRQRAERRTRS